MGDLSSEYDVVEEEDDRVHEWEHGLPHPSELPSLTQGLIPPDLLSAFNILPEPYRTSVDISRASRDTLDTIQGGPNFVKPYAENNLDEIDEEEIEDEEEEVSESKKARLSESGEGKAVKRPRLVWTPQLHKRFVEVVAHLGIKNAVPKTIMQMMNVEGLTRENVASHLQKYRLYLKRMQGVSFDPPTNSSPAPASVPPEMQIPMAGYGQPPAMMQMHMPMPVMATGHMGMGTGNHHHYHNNSNPINHHYHHNYYHHYQYNGGGITQAGNNKYGSGMNYHHPPHVAPGDK